MWSLPVTDFTCEHSPSQARKRWCWGCRTRSAVRRRRATTTRLHGGLLVVERLSCCQVVILLGDSAGTVGNWVHGFNERGLAGHTASPAFSDVCENLS